METLAIATANKAKNEARKDIVNEMIWDHEEKLIAATVECQKRESDLLEIQTGMSSKPGLSCVHIRWTFRCV
jgi:hypothetical protein